MLILFYEALSLLLSFPYLCVAIGDCVFFLLIFHLNISALSISHHISVLPFHSPLCLFFFSELFNLFAYSSSNLLNISRSSSALFLFNSIRSLLSGFTFEYEIL